jgi:hypothetical protein
MDTQDASMNDCNPRCGEQVHFELRYRSMSPYRCGYTFACDVDGRVDLDSLSEDERENYLYARAMVGMELLQPQVARVH